MQQEGGKSGRVKAHSGFNGSRALRRGRRNQAIPCRPVSLTVQTPRSYRAIFRMFPSRLPAFLLHQNRTTPRCGVSSEADDDQVVFVDHDDFVAVLTEEVV